MSFYRKVQALASAGPFILSVVALGALLLGVVALWLVEKELIARAGKSLAIGAIEVADKLDATFRERHGDIETMAVAAPLQGTERAAIRTYLETVRRAYPVYSRLSVIDRKGHVVASTDQTWIGRALQNTSWFQAIQHDPRIYVDVIREKGRRGGELVSVAFSAPVIKAADGTFLGVIITEVDQTLVHGLVEKTVSQFSAQAQNFGSVDYRILTSEGAPLLNSNEDEQAPGNLRESGLPSANNLVSGQSGYVEEEHLVRRVPVVTGYARMKGLSGTSLQWGVLVRSDHDGVVAGIRSLLVKVGLAGLGGFIPMLGLIVWAHRCQRREQNKSVEALRALAESEIRTRTVLHDAMDAVVVMDAQGMISGWNRQAEVIFGWETAEVLGKSLVETLVPPQHRATHIQGVARYLSTGEAKVLNQRIEISALRKDGTEFPIELTITPLKLERGMFFSAFVRDISDRKRMIERLRGSETFFRLLSEQLPVGVFEIDEHGVCLYKNKMWDAIMGYLNDEVFGFASAALPSGTWIDWVHPDDQPALTQSWIAAQAGFSRVHAECRLVPTDGPDRWVELQLWPMADDRGVRYLGTIEDITSRKNMTERLRMSEAFFRLLSDHLPIGVFEIDRRGACVYGNKMWRALRHLSEEAGDRHPVRSGSWLQWFHPDDREKVEEEWERTCTTFDRVAIECRLAEGGEEARWVNVLLWPMTTEEGVRYLGTLEDITERKRTVAHTMTLLKHGRFELRTLTEARNLAELLAYAFPDPLRTQLGLTELLVNGVEHGNLEISYAEKSSLLKAGRLDAEIARRLALQENLQKRVWVSMDRKETEVDVEIVDAGKGFDWRRYLALDGERSDDSHGRGIAMSRRISFDRLEFRNSGNHVIVSSQLPSPDPSADEVNGRKAA
ncbi:MAG: hypothetical protein RL768_118 [Nitrospirota bacterium]|jgi:PAS domain S-box-containing protein